jgi:hypothetical protein
VELKHPMHHNLYTNTPHSMWATLLENLNGNDVQQVQQWGAHRQNRDRSTSDCRVAASGSAARPPQDISSRQETSSLASSTLAHLRVRSCRSGQSSSSESTRRRWTV